VLNGERHVPSSLVPIDLYTIRTHPAKHVLHDNLKAICDRIQDCEKMGMVLDLDYSLTLIQLRMKLENLVRERSRGTFSDVIEDLVKESDVLDGWTYTKLKRWLAWGSRLVEFAGAGELSCNLNTLFGLT
jgi:hypothetical protein